MMRRCLYLRQFVVHVMAVICVWCTDESDEEDEGRPSRRRRLGERAAEGADDDEEVC